MVWKQGIIYNFRHQNIFIMKRLNTILLLGLFVSSMAFGQKYVLTPMGLRDSSDMEKTYLVLSCEGKTAKELYDNALKYINKVYKNPDFVTKGQIEGEFVSYDTFVENVVTIRVMGKLEYPIRYRTELTFKDGRVRYEIGDLVIGTDEGYLYVSQQGISGWWIYNKSGDLKQAGAKMQIEDYFNVEAMRLRGYLIGGIVDDDW